jgi:hypothetical protein
MAVISGHWYGHLAAWWSDASWFTKATTINTKINGKGQNITAQISLAEVNLWDDDNSAVDAYIHSYVDDSNPKIENIVGGKSNILYIEKCRKITFYLDVYGPLSMGRASILIFIWS